MHTTEVIPAYTLPMNISTTGLILRFCQRVLEVVSFSELKETARKIIALFKYWEISVLWKESGNSKLRMQLHPEQPVFAGKWQIKKGSTGVKQKKQKCFPLGFQ